MQGHHQTPHGAIIASLIAQIDAPLLYMHETAAVWHFVAFLQGKRAQSFFHNGSSGHLGITKRRRET